MARFLSLSDSFPSQHCQPPSLPSSTWRQILCSDDDDDDDDGDGDDDIGGDGADEEGAHHHHHNEWRFWKIFVGLYVWYTLQPRVTTRNFNIDRSEALIKKREVQSVWFIILVSDAPPPSPSAAAVKNCLQISQFSPKNPTFFHAI